MKTIMFGLGLLGFCGAAFADGFTLAGLATTIFSGGGASVAAGIGAGVLAAKLAASNQAAPSAPKPVMPMADDQAVQDAKRRQIAEIQTRSGRASTVLSDPGAKLGG